MSTVGDLVVNLGLRRQNFTSGLKGSKSELTSWVGGLKTTLAPLAGAVAAAFGVKASLDAARESAAAGNKLSAVLAATGGAAGLTKDEISSYASELQKLTNFEDDATIAGAAVLATFKEIKGDIFKEAIASAQDLSTVMNTDLQSSIVQIGKALNDPTKGITALSRVGVSFSAAQKDQIKQLQESGDLRGAQRIILDELKSEFGGAAKAAADPLIQLQNVLGDLGESIGGAILPTVHVLAKTLMDLPLAELGEVLGVVGAAAGDVVGLIVDLLSPAFWALGEITKGFAELIKETVAPFRSFIEDFRKWLGLVKEQPLNQDKFNFVQVGPQIPPDVAGQPPDGIPFIAPVDPADLVKGLPKRFSNQTGKDKLSQQPIDNAPLIRGSAEASKAILQGQLTGGNPTEDLMKQQVKEEKKQNTALDKLGAKMDAMIAAIRPQQPAEIAP